MSQISCFHNCAGNESPAGWQLNTRLCWVCCGCIAHLCCQLLHPPSISRGWIWPERRRDRVRDMGTEEHDYGSISSLHSSEEPLVPWSMGLTRILGVPTLFMPLQSKHPNQTNTASCLHTAASALRKFRHISSLRLFLCSSDKASLTGDVAKRIIIYRRLLFPRGNPLNTQFCICSVL